MTDEFSDGGDQPPEQLTALVVDDDPAMRALLASILLEYGHLAVTAGSAEEAMATLPLYTFQLAYLDHNLPGMEGVVFGEWLRRNNPFMQIALVTGVEDDALEERVQDRGIVFVQKPFDVHDVTELVSRYLEAARERLQRDQESESEWHAPPFELFTEELPAYFGLPSVPARIEDGLVRRINEAMANMRSVGRYSERDRVAALAGLLAARVLGVRVPRGRRDMTLYEEYDEIMEGLGRRREFTSDD